MQNPVSGVTHTQVNTHTYDAASRRTSQAISDSTGGDITRTTLWGYDPAGRLTTVTAPDATVTSQVWDTAGDVVQTTQPSGLVLNHSYDDVHRPLTTTAVGANVDAMDGTQSSLIIESKQYDPAARLATVADAMGRTTKYAYYADNLLNTTTLVRANPSPDLVTEQRSYDAPGHPTTITTAGGTITTAYTYDPAGRWSASHWTRPV